MTEKLIVHFNEMPVLQYNIDYLTYCKRCRTYNLGDKACVSCGEKHEISIQLLALYAVRKRFVIRIMLIILSFIGFALISPKLSLVCLEFLLSSLCIGMNGCIYKKYKEDMLLKEIEAHVKSNGQKIKEDLRMQMQKAIQDVEEGNVVEAYDRFRYLAKLIDNDDIRTYKLICLRNFKLRSDMPLELNTLLQKEGNSFLVDYIYEVSKIRKDLIDDATLQYIIENKEQVLAKHKGNRIVASVLSGALKSKFLFIKYAYEMPGFIKYFSRERLLRLCKMSKEIKDVTLKINLLREVKDIVGEDKKFEVYLRGL